MVGTRYDPRARVIAAGSCCDVGIRQRVGYPALKTRPPCPAWDSLYANVWVYLRCGGVGAAAGVLRYVGGVVVCDLIPHCE